LELSGLNVDYASLAVEMQAKIASESDLLSAGFPDQTIVLLSNILAGITAMLNYSQVTRDLNNFTPFAFLKSAGYAIAGTLGVSPARKRGAQMTVTISSGDGNLDFSVQLKVPIIIPAYTQFTCRGFIFHTREDYLINPTDISVELQLYEGVNNVVNFISNGEKYQRWLIGTQYDVDQNTTRVLINNEWWIAGSGTFVKYLATDQVFVPITSPDGKVLILFGNGTYGVVPSNGLTITIYYTVTVGSQGNSASVGDPVFIMDIISISPGVALNLSGISVTVASGGMDEDDLDAIKYVTPRLYASNERSVRRDDYIGQLLSANCPVAMVDARAWGEYEQATLIGLGTLEMMNRAFWGGVLATMQSYTNTNLAPADGVTTIFSFTLYHSNDPTAAPPLPIKGSLLIYSTDSASSNIVFSDLDGYGILTSPFLSIDYFQTPGTVVQTTSDSGFTIGNIIDGSPDTAWQSASTPDYGDPIFIGVTLAVLQVPVSFRIIASSDSTVDTRAFPASISVWGSNNPTVPSMLDQTLWIPIRGNVYPDDPGVEGVSRWYSLDNEASYQYILFRINDRYGSSPYVKISGIELQILPQSSTIDYETAEVVIDYGALPPPVLGTSLIAQFYGDDLSPEQQSDVQNFILGTNHFTTQFTFSSVRMVRADLNLQVYYNAAYSRNTILNNVSQSLQNLLTVIKGSISRSVKFSDLTGAVTSVTGVDYCIFLNPPNGQNIDCDIDQYVYLTSLTIEMVLSDRASR
jgi:hypothetical protein